VFITGHDPDFHAVDNPGARNINTVAIGFVMDPAFNSFVAGGVTKFLFVQSAIQVPGGHRNGKIGIVNSGYVEGADFETHTAATLNAELNLLGTKYSAIVVASDFGGILTQAELDILSARSVDIISFLNNGGGLYAMSESNLQAQLTPGGGHFGFLPFLVSSAAVSQVESQFQLTAFGASLGLTLADIQSNVSHCVFLDDAGLSVVDLDQDSRIVSLAGRGVIDPNLGLLEVSLSQDEDTNLTGTNHTVTATVVNGLGEPQEGVTVTFTVLSGPNAGTSGTCSANAACETDAAGEVSFTYLGDGGVGIDTIQASFVNDDQETVLSNELEKTWTNNPPVALCRNVTLDADGNCEASQADGAAIDDGSYDPDGDAITLVQEPAGPYPLGDTVVDLIVTDVYGAADTCTAVVTVVDTTPPTISVVLDRDVLWPPNHKMVDICATVTVSDNCADEAGVSWVLSGATSDEPDDAQGGGDGNTVNDIQSADLGTADAKLQLRSERLGNGDGRKYTLTYLVTDGAGNIAEVSVCVTVPHDQSGAALLASTFDPYDPDGEGAGDLRVVIPGSGGVNVLHIDSRRAYVGNQVGVVAPIRSEVTYADGDQTIDLVLTYPTREIRELVVEELPGVRVLVGLHYATANGNYLVKDLFSQMRISIAPGVSDRDTGDDVQDGNDQGGNGLGDYITSPIGEVVVEVFSVTGARLQILVRSRVAADLSDLGWDRRDATGRAVPNGIYFYRVRVEDRDIVRKVRVVRE
jgi:hypothetical protein